MAKKGMKFNIEFEGSTALFRSLDELADSHTPKGYWAVGSPLDYSVHQEHGTSRMAAQPHLRPAIDVVRNQHMARAVVDADDIHDYLRRLAYLLEAETKRRTPVLTGKLRSSYQTVFFPD